MPCLFVVLLGAMGLGPPAQQLVAANVARSYVDEELAVTPARVEPPANVVIPDVYRATVSSMLRYSATFRGQCSRIARAGDLRVILQRSLLPATQAAAALTRITRRPEAAPTTCT
jgi:hypothetical protein